MAKEKEAVAVVTGGLGFIGSHFIELLLEKGFRVINIDKVTYASDPKINAVFKRKYPRHYTFIKKDINDLKELPQCRYVVHFAAESHVDNSIRSSQVFTKSNVMGTHNLLDLLVKRPEKPMFIYVSTDEVFGDIKDGFFKEDDRLLPSNPYSASKAGGEMLVLAYGRTFGIPYKITRTTNNYGSRQHPEKLIPSAILRLLKGEKILIHGTGEQVRNWIHVKDNCRAIYDVMTKGRANETYHVASPEELSVNQIAEIILRGFGKPFNDSTVEYVRDRAGQDIRYALDDSKLRKLGWKPEDKLQDQIGKLIKKYAGRYQKKSLVSLLINRLAWPK